MSAIEDNMIIFLNNCLREASTIGEVSAIHDIMIGCQGLLVKRGLKSTIKYEGLIEGYCIEHR